MVQQIKHKFLRILPIYGLKVKIYVMKFLVGSGEDYVQEKKLYYQNVQLFYKI